MKRFGLIVLFLLALAAPALGQSGGDISAYADDQGNSCNVTANGGGGFVSVFFVHKFKLGEESTGARFKATFPAGFVFFALSTPFTTVGALLTDLSIGYGVCTTTTTLIGTALLQSAAASPTCSYIEVGAADNFADPLGTDCGFGQQVIGVGSAIVNSDGSCPCNIAVEETSWGKVKALYR